MASLSTLFHQTYALSETVIGFCFLALAGGLLFGGVIGGKFLDWDYERIKNQIIREAEAVPEKFSSPQEAVNDKNLPIEKARLRTSPIYISLIVATSVGYGWAIHRKTSIAVPLVLHFIRM
jgi:membrane protease YdiL (CAAX protease family)